MYTVGMAELSTLQQTIIDVQRHMLLKFQEHRSRDLGVMIPCVNGRKTT